MLSLTVGWWYVTILSKHRRTLYTLLTCDSVSFYGECQSKLKHRELLSELSICIVEWQLSARIIKSRRIYVWTRTNCLIQAILIRKK